MHPRFQRGKRLGLTLIEVVVGLAIAGSLLSVVIMTSTHHVKQLRLAKQKRAALQSVDRFLSIWSRYDFRAADRQQSEEEFAEASSPNITGQFRLEVSTVVNQEAIQPAFLEPVRVSMFDPAGRRITFVDIARLKEAQ